MFPGIDFQYWKSIIDGKMPQQKDHKFLEDAPLITIFKEIYFILIALGIGNALYNLSKGGIVKLINEAASIIISISIMIGGILTALLGKGPLYFINANINFIQSILFSNGQVAYSAFQQLKALIFQHTFPDSKIWLFGAFLITLIRFSLGGIIALEEHKEDGNKPQPREEMHGSYWNFLQDLHCYIITMILFLLLSQTIMTLIIFKKVFIVLLIWDLIWIFFFNILFEYKKGLKKRFIKFEPWITSNFIILSSLWFFPRPFIIFIACILAAYYDYYRFKDYYCRLMGFSCEDTKLSNNCLPLAHNQSA